VSVIEPTEGAAPVRRRRYPSREDTIGFLVWEARRAYYRDFGERIAEHGISFGVFPVLRVLWDEDRLTQAEIIKRLRMKGPTIVGIVAQLEADGLISRIQDPHDRRKRSIALTARGEALRDVIMPISEDVNRRAMKGFTTEERRALKCFLRRLRSNLEPGDEALEI
jgi:DNA-binding MarR family transcriptional regulator